MDMIWNSKSAIINKLQEKHLFACKRIMTQNTRAYGYVLSVVEAR